MSQHEGEDLPDGVIDADPAGGWESADVADGETRERSDAETIEAGQPSGVNTGYAAEGDADVESAEATQGADPDLVTDADAERRR